MGAGTAEEKRIPPRAGKFCIRGTKCTHNTHTHTRDWGDASRLSCVCTTVPAATGHCGSTGGGLGDLSAVFLATAQEPTTTAK